MSGASCSRALGRDIGNDGRVRVKKRKRRAMIKQKKKETSREVEGAAVDLAHLSS